MSEEANRLSRRALLGRAGATAGALALGGVATAGVAGADDVEHGFGGLGLADGSIETGEVFTLGFWGETVDLDDACLADTSTSLPFRRYSVEYCAVDAAADLYVQPGVVQPESTDAYVFVSATPCDGTDHDIVSFAPVNNPRGCIDHGFGNSG